MARVVAAPEAKAVAPAGATAAAAAAVVPAAAAAVVPAAAAFALAALSALILARKSFLDKPGSDTSSSSTSSSSAAAAAAAAVVVVKPPPPPLFLFFFGGMMWWAGGWFCMMSAKRHTKTVCRGLLLRVVCRRDMPFLEKIADITMSGRHVGNMSATFPAKPRTRCFVRRWVLTEVVYMYMQVATGRMRYTLVDVVIPVHMQACSIFR